MYPRVPHRVPFARSFVHSLVPLLIKTDEQCICGSIINFNNSTASSGNEYDDGGGETMASKEEEKKEEEGE